jgi:uncharacterized protein YceK
MKAFIILLVLALVLSGCGRTLLIETAVGGGGSNALVHEDDTDGASIKQHYLNTSETTEYNYDYTV